MAVGAVAMGVVMLLTLWIYHEDAGSPEMREVARYIRNGAKTFLKRQYRTILLFVAILSAPIYAFFQSWEVVFSFLVGASLSLAAAYIGMNVAVRANVRTAKAALNSTEKAFNIAFRGGAVMGLSVGGLSLLGISVLYLFYGYKDPSLLIGYGFGASLAALFAQLGGGIFTKSADIGADLVGKIEQNIPEDDIRNPAVIADQVGDNVGDCAGRGSDLFESISDDFITAMIVGFSLFVGTARSNALMFPFALGIFGILATMVGIAVVRGWKHVKPINSFNIGLFAAATVAVVGAYFASTWLFDDLLFFYCTLSGIVASMAVGLAVQYYIGSSGKPVMQMEEASKRGVAMNLITGLAYGLQSPFLPFITIIGSKPVAIERAIVTTHEPFYCNGCIVINGI